MNTDAAPWRPGKGKQELKVRGDPATRNVEYRYTAVVQLDHRTEACGEEEPEHAGLSDKFESGRGNFGVWVLRIGWGRVRVQRI